MKPTVHKQKCAAMDVTGWLLGSVIVVLAVLDLLIWATLSNVPNPGSQFLLGPTPQLSLHDIDGEPFGAVQPDGSGNAAADASSKP